MIIISNYYENTDIVAANWKGFHDEESGIWGYTWAVGREICGTNVVPYEDPYAHLTSSKFWTDSAFHKDVLLADGRYFVTIQALNNAELGGSLVTTVCHSTPFTVDTTPPVFHGVTDIVYDEDFDLIAIYYNATDNLSKISHAEFGLGKTTYDVDLKQYSLHAPMDREDPFVAVNELGLKEGEPAWIRIRVTNNGMVLTDISHYFRLSVYMYQSYTLNNILLNVVLILVDLFTAGHGKEPILIDKSPPIPGSVMDGKQLGVDRQYQADNSSICAQWIDFFDPESGIDK